MNQRLAPSKTTTAVAALNPKPSLKQAARRVAILVLGMHRSGTSAITRVISLLGADLPKHTLPPSPSNERGHWEPACLVALHERMLADFGSRWDDWRALDFKSISRDKLAEIEREIDALVNDEFRSSPLVVLKDPRICRFGPLYKRLLAANGIEPRFVIPLRNPLAIMASLKARDGMTAGHTGLLWLRHVLDGEAATRASPRAFVSYEALMTDWRQVVQRLSARIGVRWPRPIDQTAAEIDAFLAAELQHHAPSPRALAARNDVVAWVKDLYQALLDLEENAHDEAALAVVDQVRAEFEQVCPVFGDAMFAELAARESRSAHVRAALEQEIGALKDSLAERSTKVTELSQMLSTRTCESGALRELLAEQEAQLALLQGMVADLYASRSWRATAPLRSAARLIRAARL